MGKRAISIFLTVALVMFCGLSAAADSFYECRCEVANEVLDDFYKARGGKSAVQKSGLLAGVYMEPNNDAVMHIALTDEAVLADAKKLDIEEIAQRWCGYNTCTYSAKNLAKNLIVWEYKPYSLVQLESIREILWAAKDALHIYKISVSEPDNTVCVGVADEADIAAVERFVAVDGSIPAETIAISVSTGGVFSLDIRRIDDVDASGIPWYFLATAVIGCAVVLGGTACLILHCRKKSK